ncbi:MAG: hypothetical protein ACI4JQ_03070 [Ruminococcus sp.]
MQEIQKKSVAVTVAALGIALLLCFSSGCSDQQSETNEMNQTTTASTTDALTTVTETTSVTTKTTMATTTASMTTTETTTTKPNVDVSAYIGYWHKNSVGQDRELSILDVSDHEVVFTLWYYRMDSIDSVSAVLEGDTAYFDMEDISGSLTFSNDVITVQITESTRPFMPVECLTFDGRHSHSWQNEGFETESAFIPYTVQVMNPYVAIFNGPGYNYDIVGAITDQSTYTIVEEDSTGLWGKLKSGAGWIQLSTAMDASNGGNSYEGGLADDGLDPDEMDMQLISCIYCGYEFYEDMAHTEFFMCPSCGYGWTYW